MLGRFEKEKVDAVLKRRGPGAYVSGEWVPGAFVPPEGTPVRIIAPQPVKANELDPLPEGERIRNYRKTWFDELLRTRDGDEDSDVIVYDGSSYEVYEASDRHVLGNYYRVIMREIF